MKRAFLFFAAIFAAVTVSAQSELDEEKPKLEQSVSEEMKSLQTAYSLAEYGYANNSSSALIGAAEILAQISTQELGITPEKKGEKAESEKPASESGFTAEKLLEDGKKLAGKDKTMLQWAAKVEKLLKKSGTRGAVGGPKYDYSFAYGYNGTTRYKIPFYAGRFAEVMVRSIDYADLDLYIYDENWNLITKDTSYNLGCYASFVPKWTGSFWIVIKNTSPWDCCYGMFTN